MSKWKKFLALKKERDADTHAQSSSGQSIIIRLIPNAILGGKLTLILIVMDKKEKNEHFHDDNEDDDPPNLSEYQLVKYRINQFVSREITAQVNYVCVVFKGTMDRSIEQTNERTNDDYVRDFRNIKKLKEKRNSSSTDHCGPKNSKSKCQTDIHHQVSTTHRIHRLIIYRMM